MQKNLNTSERRGTKANLKKSILLLKKPTVDTTPNSFSPKSTIHSSEREAFVYGVPQLKLKEKKAEAQGKQPTQEEIRKQKELDRVLNRIKEKTEQRYDIKKKVKTKKVQMGEMITEYMEKNIVATEDSVEHINMGSPKKDEKEETKESP